MGKQQKKRESAGTPEPEHHHEPDEFSGEACRLCGAQLDPATLPAPSTHDRVVTEPAEPAEPDT